MRVPPAFAALLLLAGCGGEEPSMNKQAESAAPRSAPAPKAPAKPASPPSPPHTTPWSATGYALNGTEPFWGGSVTGTRVRYMTPDDQFGDLIETRLSYAPDRETYTGSWRGAPFVLTLSRGPCSDGMSDRAYAFSVELHLRGEPRRGCADPQ